ncbi:hypothetical protein Tco_1357984 [Tanacetum coccineum]
MNSQINQPSKVEVVVVRGCDSRGGGSWWLSWMMAVRVATGCGAGEGWSGVELVTRMASGVWGSDDGDGYDGDVMVAAVGRQPEEVKARGSEWIWGSGRSGHEDNIWFRPERSPENFSGGGGMVAGGGGRREGWPEIWRRWRRKMMFVCVLFFV